MGTFIGFELRKILKNRAGMVACVLALAMLVVFVPLAMRTFTRHQVT